MRNNYQIDKWVVVMLALVGGATALAHQFLWTRRMVDLMGASAGAAARVFGCFFFGLALGAWMGAVLVPRARRPWRTLGVAEMGIALLGLPMLFLTRWADGLWPWLGPELLTGLPGHMLKTVLSVLLVLPPATLMGLFLPLAVAGWPDRCAERDPGLWLYAVNTLGAVLGIAVVTLWLLPHGGMQTAMMVAMAANVAAAAGCFLIDYRHRRESAPPQRLRPAGGRPAPQYLWIAALSGGLVMAVEVMALLVVQLLAPMSFYAPAAVLASFIALLALAAFGTATISLRYTLREPVLIRIATLAGILLLLTPLLFHALAARFPVSVETGSVAFFWLRLSLFALLVFGPALCVAGLWFPVLLEIAGTADGADRRGRWGWLLACNGAGGWVGTECAYLVMLPRFGPFVGLGVCGLVYLIAAWILLPARPRAGLLVPVYAGLTAAVVLLVYTLPRLPTVHPVFAPLVLAEHNGREGSLAVIDGPDMGRALLLQNQYILGSTRAQRAQERQAHIPLLLHPTPLTTGFIGLATGSTAGAALAHRAVERVAAVELSRTVVEAAAAWFTDVNAGIVSHPRAQVAIEDGRTWLAAHIDYFDVLISDLFLPWGPGEGRLYTLEHFTAAHRSLRADGLFCLWLPMYQLTEPQFHVILNTFRQVFPEAGMIRRDRDSEQPALALLGWKSAGHPDWSIFERRVREEREQLTDPLFHLHHGVPSLVLDVQAPAHDQHVPVNTLANLWLEIDAGRTRIRQPDTAPYLAHERWRDFLQRHRAPPAAKPQAGHLRGAFPG
jgi:spermidine synthase